MEGVEAEYELFSSLHPAAKVLPVAAPGGAARQLAERIATLDRSKLFSVDFARLFYSELVSSASQGQPANQPIDGNA